MKDFLPVALCVLLTAVIFYVMFKKSSVSATFDEFVGYSVLERESTQRVIKQPRREDIGDIGTVKEGFEVETKSMDSAADNDDKDKTYENRLMILKMFDALGKKPSQKELDKISSLPSKADIMQYMVDVAEENKTREQMKPISNENKKEISKKEEFFDAVIVPDEHDTPLPVIDTEDVYAPIIISNNKSNNSSNKSNRLMAEYMDLQQPVAANAHDENIHESVSTINNTPNNTPNNSSTPIASATSASKITKPVSKMQKTIEPNVPPPPPHKSSVAKQYVQDVYALLGKIDNEIDTISQ